MNTFLFAVWPYLALTVAVGFGLARYFGYRYTWTSLSSQVIENRALFWGSVPWHYGIIPILLAHLLVGLFPGAAAAVLGNPIRLVVFEVTGLALGLFCLLGILVLFFRRTSTRAAAVTSTMDWLLLVSLLVQTAAGVGIALFVRWGSLWYVHAIGPWFRSLAQFAPNVAPVAPLPGVVQLHIVNGFLLFALFPFTRLVHLVSVPLSYLWRPYQIVNWLRPRGAERP